MRLLAFLFCVFRVGVKTTSVSERVLAAAAVVGIDGLAQPLRGVSKTKKKTISA